MEAHSAVDDELSTIPIVIRNVAQLRCDVFRSGISFLTVLVTRSRGERLELQIMREEVEAWETLVMDLSNVQLLRQKGEDFATRMKRVDVSVVPWKWCWV
jgi:hypothetical protein